MRLCVCFCSWKLCTLFSTLSRWLYLSFDICSSVVPLKRSYRRCSLKELFLKTMQNSQENTWAIVPFLLKKRLQNRRFPVNFEKFKNIFFTEHLREFDERTCKTILTAIISFTKIAQRFEQIIFWAYQFIFRHM